MYRIYLPFLLWRFIMQICIYQQRQRLEEKKRSHYMLHSSTTNLSRWQRWINETLTEQESAFFLFSCTRLNASSSYRSNSRLINYTENLWTSKCHPKTSRLTRFYGGHEGMVLISKRKTFYFGRHPEENVHLSEQTELCSISKPKTSIQDLKLKFILCSSANLCYPKTLTNRVSLSTFSLLQLRHGWHYVKINWHNMM